MYTLTTTLELPIAHRLETAFSGLCVGNIGIDKKRAYGNPVVHGHNYFVTFDISARKLNEDGMLVDFKKIKEILHDVFDKYDHSLILKEGDPVAEFYKNNSENSRVFVWKQNPTAEHMAYVWYYELMDELRDLVPGVRLRISVEETSHNKVTYEED